MSPELTSLLVAARDGDDEALASAIRIAQPDVWRYVAGVAGRGDADDITQDTFLRAFRALPRYRAESSGRTWLLSIAHRAAVDAIRRDQRVRRIHDRARTEARPVPSASEHPHTLAALVARLEPDRREAFVLTQWIGCSYQEAATIVGVPVGTIRSRVARAREHLIRDLRAADTA
jgi:RNA polymerase sigma-70 factor (ECF subfamily)